MLAFKSLVSKKKLLTNCLLITNQGAYTAHTKNN